MPVEELLALEDGEEGNMWRGWRQKVRGSCWGGYMMGTPEVERKKMNRRWRVSAGRWVPRTRWVGGCWNSLFIGYLWVFSSLRFGTFVEGQHDIFGFLFDRSKHFLLESTQWTLWIECHGGSIPHKNIGGEPLYHT